MRAQLLAYIEREICDLTKLSRRCHLVIFAAIAGPSIITVAFVAFPVLERFNLGFWTFHLACAMGCTAAGSGITLWISEVVLEKAPLRWVLLTILVTELLVSIGLLLFGDFYWAFQRGYFVS